MTISNMLPDRETGLSARDRIMAAAEAIIAASGVDAATTRAVAEAAGVQAPTLYRLFGDKNGLLDAVAQHVMAAYVAEKGQRASGLDPVEDLRAGWDAHIGFGLAHPGIFLIMAARPTTAADTPAMQQGLELLRRKMRALATAGQLRMPEERALALFHAAATGTIFTLLRQSETERDMLLSREAREAAIAAVSGATASDAADDVRGMIIALRTRLPGLEGLTDGERLLLSELMDRLANATPIYPAQ